MKTFNNNAKFMIDVLLLLRTCTKIAISLSPVLRVAFTKLIVITTVIGLCFSSSAQEIEQQARYLLSAGDKIKISVYDEEDLSFDEMILGESGTITYPFLGEIRVTGSTLAGLESAIARGLVEGEYLIQPEVTVSILEYRPFYIDGEVNTPGGYPFEPGLTLRRAVTLAGGFTERASRSKISIISEITLSNGQQSSSTSEEVSLEGLVRPGDTITVPQRFF